MVIYLIKAVIFDLDGTLIDSVDAHSISWVKAFEAHGYYNINIDDVRKLIGLSGKDIVKILLGQEALMIYKSIQKVKDTEFLRHTNNIKLFPGVKKILNDIKQVGLKLALATSTPSHILNHILPALTLENRFDVIIPGDMVRKGKPDPDIFIKAFEALKISPNNGIIIGDSEYDIIPAKAIGAKSILILTSELTDPSKFSVKPDFIVKDFSEISSIIKRILENNR